MLPHLSVIKRLVIKNDYYLLGEKLISRSVLGRKLKRDIGKSLVLRLRGPRVTEKPEVPALSDPIKQGKYHHAVDRAVRKINWANWDWSLTPSCIYMQPTLEHLRAQGGTRYDEGISTLSLHYHKHINMLGFYSFTLAEPTTKGFLQRSMSDLTHH